MMGKGRAKAKQESISAGDRLHSDHTIPQSHAEALEEELH